MFDFYTFYNEYLDSTLLIWRYTLIIRATFPVIVLTTSEFTILNWTTSLTSYAICISLIWRTKHQLACSLVEKVKLSL